MLHKNHRLLFCSLLCAASFLAYAPSLHGDFLWDDDAYISQNVSLNSIQGLHDLWLKPGTSQQYYPVTFTVFWIEHRLWGLNSFGYHAVNVLLHGLNAALFGILLEEVGMPGAWVAAALFALHPVQAESVAWMTELKNVLSTFFYLLTLLVLLRKKKSGGQNYIALLLFACALLSKSVTVSLPVSYVLISWWMRGKWDKQKAREMLPFLALGMLAALYTTYYEHHLVRAQGTPWNFTLAERVGIAGHAFWFYIGKLLYPAALSFIYPRWPVPQPIGMTFLWPAAAIGLLALLAYGRRRWGKLPFACALFFAISIAPALGLTSFYFMRFSFVADHFQYLASLGAFALAGWIFSSLFRKLGVPLPSPAAILVALLLSVNLGLATARQSRKYVDSFHLWQDTLALNPDSAIAHHNMGIALAGRSQWNEAIAHLRTAEALDPSFPQTHLALAYFAVGAGRWEDARHQYQEAIRDGLDDPALLKDLDRAISERKPLGPTSSLGLSDRQI